MLSIRKKDSVYEYLFNETFQSWFWLEKKYSSKGFEIACRQYDNSNIINQNISFISKDIQQIYISNLIRSELTYNALKIDIKANKTELINEVPIVPFIQTMFKLPTFIWMAVGRIQWLLNIKIQPEIRNDTLKKIDLLISKLEKDNNDTLIIGHGFYFSQLKRVLKKRRYSGKAKLNYKNGEIVRFNKVWCQRTYVFKIDIAYLPLNNLPKPIRESIFSWNALKNLYWPNSQPDQGSVSW